jgi:ATP-dependent helicase/nuclease subunit A
LPVPVFVPRAAERGGPLDDVKAEAEARELEEHWRLFYVAATRAEEQLVIAGSLGPRCKGVAPEASWYAAADRAMAELGVVAGEGVRTFGDPLMTVPSEGDRAGIAGLEPPEWARRPAPQEARPARPLAPSSLGDDTVSDPPPSATMRAAAERGRLLHALFERLPDVPSADRATAADRWLAGAGGVADAGERAALTADVLRIVEDTVFAELFGPDSLAEAPLAATVEGGVVVSGRVDRLLVRDDVVRVVDFKTGRRVPDVPPPYHLAQMAGYAAALGAIFPGRRIEAGLLYTAGPKLVVITPEQLAAHKPGFAGTEQSLPLTH